MKVLDSGHMYHLRCLDGDASQLLQFVKRCSPPEKFPGNANAYPGTTLQEVLRACCDRLRYVNGQIQDSSTEIALEKLRDAIWYLEARAARKHGRPVAFNVDTAEFGEVCAKCGHVECLGACHPLEGKGTMENTATADGTD